jgi:hypothetical protein
VGENQARLRYNTSRFEDGGGGLRHLDKLIQNLVPFFALPAGDGNANRLCYWIRASWLPRHSDTVHTADSHVFRKMMDSGLHSSPIHLKPTSNPKKYTVIKKTN